MGHATLSLPFFSGAKTDPYGDSIVGIGVATLSTGLGASDGLTDGEGETVGLGDGDGLGLGD